jgi:hypothetical protein
MGCNGINYIIRNNYAIRSRPDRALEFAASCSRRTSSASCAFRLPFLRSVTPSATIAGPRRASPYLPRVGLSHDSRQRGHASCHGEVRALSSETPGRPNQGVRVGRTPVGQLDGQSEESCVPGRNKPLTFLAWLTCGKVAPIGFLWLAGVFFAIALNVARLVVGYVSPESKACQGVNHVVLCY